MASIQIEEVRRFMVQCLVAAGAPEVEARKQAALLLHADVTGHYSHGLNRLGLYVNDLQSGATNPAAQPEILKESAGTAWVDGRDALGATVGNFCMELAIKKAREAGIGWVSVKGCNHFGMAGYWAQMAEKEGLIGMAFTNSSPIMVPTRAKEGAMGTNPIAMAAPASNGDSLVVDMAMTTVAMGKVEVQVHKEEPIPKGWALGPDGNVTTDANLAYATGRLMPLGGFEETSGYKGSGLSAMVEVFCSGLSGSNPSPKVRPWTMAEKAAPPNLGQCYAAINPGCFAPGFGARLAECLHHWRSMEPVDPSLPVLVPGDKERMKLEQTRQRGSILYARKQIDTCNSFAETLGVQPLQTS